MRKPPTLEQLKEAYKKEDHALVKGILRVMIEEAEGKKNVSPQTHS